MGRAPQLLPREDADFSSSLAHFAHGLILDAELGPAGAEAALGAFRQAAALDATLSNLRTAIELYYQQHGSYPSAVAAGGSFGAINTEAAFRDQLVNYTSATGAAFPAPRYSIASNRAGRRDPCATPSRLPMPSARICASSSTA